VSTNQRSVRLGNADALSEALSKILLHFSHLSLETAHVSSFIFRTLLDGATFPNMLSLRLDITNLVLTKHEINTCAGSDFFPEQVCWGRDPRNNAYWPLERQVKRTRKPYRTGSRASCVLDTRTTSCLPLQTC
jgi:hypothetical protein